MAHYAFLDENNVVTEVIVGKNEWADGIDWEIYYGNIREQVCKRTYYNTIGGVHNRPLQQARTRRSGAAAGQSALACVRWRLWW